MHFTKVFLKTGQTMIGYITNTYGEQIQMLQLKENKLEFIIFLQSIVDKTEKLRELSSNEKEYIHAFTASSKELADTEYKIRLLQSHYDQIGDKREKLVKELFNESLLSKDKNKETKILSVTDIENSLTRTGFKNLYVLQRYDLIVLGEHEEILYLNEEKEMIPLFGKHANNIITLLNKPDLTKEGASHSLSVYALDSTSEKLSFTFERLNKSEEVREETQEDTQPNKVELNFNNIKEKLNEHGFQKLRKLQEKKVLTIHEDGKMEFGEVGEIPFLNVIFSKPHLIVDFLNTPIPTYSSPIMKNMEGILKIFEQQLKANSKKE